MVGEFSRQAGGAFMDFDCVGGWAGAEWRQRSSRGQFPCVTDDWSYGPRVTNPAGTAPVFTPCQSVGLLALIVVIFFTSLAATGGLLTCSLPFPLVPKIEARYRYFAERKDDFDTLFIGSSRIRYQVIPQQFDAETAARGAPTNSINLGYSGMWLPESYYFLRQLLALHPRHLRWVVIELMDHRSGLADREPPTMRMVYWHDWKHAGMALRFVWESPLPIMEKGQQLAMHARMFLQRMTNPGRGAEWLRERYMPSNNKWDSNWMNRVGFDTEAGGEWGKSRRADFTEDVEMFKKLPSRCVRPGMASALREIIDDVHRAGAETVFVFPPSVLVEENLTGGMPQGMILWAFNKPLEYPRLYLPELHYESGHLNEDGAREFTGLLAQRLADMAQKR